MSSSEFTPVTVAEPDRLAGTARLPIVITVALVSFFYANLLDYALPLYLGAREAAALETGGSFPRGMFATLAIWRVTPWIIGPMIAGVLARLIGERTVWSLALAGKLAVPLTLVFHPHPDYIAMLAIWQGFTGALMWIAGLSLVQMVTPERKGFSNGLLMTSMGIGSLLGPICGRLLLYRVELVELISAGEPGEALRRMFNFSRMTSTPGLVDFELLFWILAGTTAGCSLLIGLWGQRPGRYQRDEPPTLNQTIADLKTLATMPRFWALVIPLCLFGGAVFGTSNYYLPYRAEDLGLKDGSSDNGWIWLTLLKTLMWIPGGLAVGLLAGRRAPGIAAVLMIGTFSAGATCIGASRLAWQLFASVAVFEFTRQFMRWSHGGYLTEHIGDRLRPTAIGFAITFSGLGETIYGWTSKTIWNPDLPGFESWRPICLASIAGLCATVVLFFYDRARPIRAETDTDPPVVPDPPGEISGETLS
ncbi:MAG: hypothetical protein CMJ65_01260 [Planctomycetaceae bacterium]|jgi:hypothetical protein|nr:hypothetical protein [Planctomycetaceae bacterium]